MASRSKIIHPIEPEIDYNNTDSDSSRPSSPTRDYPENLNASPKNTLDPNYPNSRPSIEQISPKISRRTKEVSSRSAQANNAAYKLHLKNHLKYATVKNVANYGDCPICQQFGMGDVYVPPAQQRSPAEVASVDNRVFDGIPVYGRSPNSPRRVSRTPHPPIYQRRSSTDSSDDQMGYFKEMAEPDSIYFKVMKSRRAQAAQELTVVKNEFLRIIDGEGNWWACENKYGYAGYVPKKYFATIDTGNFSRTNN